MIIYKTTNLLNDKIYIGKDKNNNPNYLGSGIILNHSINKHGKENFIKDIIEYCSNKDELNIREKYWIEFYKSYDKNIGYNITKGGDGGDIFTYNPNKEEIRKKYSIIQKELNNRAERKSANSKVHLGRKRPKETGEKISKALSELYKDPIKYQFILDILNKGMNSPESLRKRSEQTKGKILRKIPATEEERKLHGSKIKKLWENIEYRDLVMSNRRKALDEGRGKRSQDGTRRAIESQNKKIYQYNMNIELVKIWPSHKSIKEFYKSEIPKRWKIYFLDKDIPMKESYWKSQEI